MFKETFFHYSWIPLQMLSHCLPPGDTAHGRCHQPWFTRQKLWFELLGMQTPDPRAEQWPRLNLASLGGLRDRNIFLLVVGLAESQGGGVGL